MRQLDHGFVAHRQKALPGSQAQEAAVRGWVNVAVGGHVLAQMQRLAHNELARRMGGLNIKYKVATRLQNVVAKFSGKF